MLALIWIIVFKMSFSFAEGDLMRSVNLVPYSAPMRIGGEIVYEEIIFNALAFLPFGLYAEILFKKWNIFQKTMLFLLVSVSFEVIQYIFAIGVSDITDVINNVLGGIAGVLIYKGIEKILNSRHQTHKFVNLIAAAGTLLVLVLLAWIRI
jgi:glycopeptide antibiotics resistance protein